METTLQENTWTESGTNLTEECIHASIACYQACTNTISYCLTQRAFQESEDHIQLMKECAEMCNVNVMFIQMNAKFSNELSELCAKICDACADACLEAGYRDPILKQCALVCLKCSETCRRVIH